MSPEVQNSGISGLIKRTDVLQKFLKNRLQQHCLSKNGNVLYFIIILWIYQWYLPCENADVVNIKLFSTCYYFCYFEYRVRQQSDTDLPPCHESFSGAWRRFGIIFPIIQMSNSKRNLHLFHC